IFAYASGSEDRHRFALPVHDIIDLRRHVLILPKIAGTTVLRPAFAIGRLTQSLLETSAGVRLEIGHHFFGFGIGGDDNVNMRRANVTGPNGPTAMFGNLEDGRQHDGASGSIE